MVPTATKSKASRRPAVGASNVRVFIVGALLAVATFLAYAESLAGLFFLLTFYAFVCAAEGACAAAGTVGGTLRPDSVDELPTGRASPEAHQNLAIILAELRRLAEAASHYETVLKPRPTYASAHYNYGNTLLMPGRIDDAQKQFEQALACDSGFAAAHEMLDRLRAVPR